jgi:hypothetical protein
MIFLIPVFNSFQIVWKEGECTNAPILLNKARVITPLSLTNESLLFEVLTEKK